MADLLRDYERKRERAMLHGNVLREQVERATNVERELVRGEFQRNASQYTFDIPVPRVGDWAVLFGDFLYNTRASLDYLITALIRSTGEEENETSEFPIYVETPKVRWMELSGWWDGRGADGIERRLQGTPSGTKAALKKLQPFHGVPTRDPSAHPLFALYTLNNRDKHRRLNLFARRVAIGFVDAQRQPMFHGIPFYDGIAESHEGDTYPVKLTVGPDQADVDVYLLSTYEIWIDERPQFVGEVVKTLTGINQFIDAEVLPTVKALL